METIDKFLIERPYYSQRNNVHKPYGTCFNTSVACLLSAYVDEQVYAGVQLEDYIWQECNNGIGKEYAQNLPYFPYLNGNNPNRINYFKSKILNTVWDVERYVANNIQNKVKIKWIENGNEFNIIKKILSRSPVLVQIYNSAGGHIITILGFENDDYIVHDSYGNWIDNYNDTNGKYVRYPIDMLNENLMGKPIRMMFMES